MPLKHIAAAIFVVVVFSGCEKNNLGTVDVKTDVPLLSSPVVTPDSVYLDALTPSGDSYPVSASVAVRSTMQEASQTLLATVLRPGSASTVLQITLRDNGSPPDLTAGDGIFSGTIQFSLTRAQAGNYRIRFSATTADGLSSNTLEKTLKLARRNSPPQLLAVTVPDTIDLPASDTIRVQFTATVSDSDGLADVREVFFRRISPPDPTRFLMKDDGSLEPAVLIGGIPLKSGDDVPGDGRYSFLIPVLPTSTRRTNVFEFQCIDSFGDTSRTIQRSFTIR